MRWPRFNLAALLLRLALEYEAISRLLIGLYFVALGLLLKLYPKHQEWTVVFGILLPVTVGAWLVVTNLSPWRRAVFAVKLRRDSDLRVLAFLVTELDRTARDVERRSTKLNHFLHRLPTEERIRDRSLYLTNLYDEVAAHFRVSREVIEALFKTPARVLTSRFERMVELQSSSTELRRRTRSKAGGQTQVCDQIKVRDQIEEEYLLKCLNELKVYTNILVELAPDIPRVLQRVVKEASTGKAAVAAANLLAEYVNRPRYHNVLTHLLTLRRGLPLHSLLRFPELIAAVDAKRLQPEAVRNYYRYFSGLASKATLKVCNNFANHLALDLKRNEVLVTFGLSNAVASAIEALAKKAPNCHLRVVVIEPEKTSDWERLVFDDEAKLMKSRLDEISELAGVTRDDIALAVETDLPTRMTRILIGAENVHGSGMVIHPRGRRSLQMRLIGDRPGTLAKCPIYVIAESYKFVELEEEVYASPHNVTFGPSEYAFLLTESQIFRCVAGQLADDAGNAFRLETVAASWEAFADKELQAEPHTEPVFDALKAAKVCTACGLQHPPELVTWSERNPTQQPRPYHCPQCREANRADKVPGHWDTGTVARAVGCLASHGPHAPAPGGCCI